MCITPNSKPSSQRLVEFGVPVEIHDMKKNSLNAIPF